MAVSSKAVELQATPKKKMPRGKPFVKGDPRINRAGRLPPKDLRELQALIDEIFAEEVTDSKGTKMDKLSVALNKLLLGKSPAGAIHILDRRFGKVPTAVDITSKGEQIKGYAVVTPDDWKEDDSGSS